MRPNAILRLLESVSNQKVYPVEILVIDGSTDFATQHIFEKKAFKNLKYFKVEESDRGLTKQRNFGISKISDIVDIVAFLDDDTVLKEDYFKEVLKTFNSNDKIIGVGGVSINDNRWELKVEDKIYNNKFYYHLENYVIKEGIRNVLRNFLGLQSNLSPSRMPNFSNGRTYNYPLNGKTYEVDLLIGMSFSFRKKIFERINFSTYFEGYGLYEDADFSIRAQKFGKNVVATKCKLYHFHDEAGRPNKFKYGVMVLRNGWYVWRLKYPNPSLKSRFKWNSIAFLLTLIRFVNVITTSDRKSALTEAFGRTYGWFSLIFNKPLIER